MDQILSYLAGVLGVDQPTFLLILGVVIAVANLLGRAIPDDATGVLGIVRKVCKVLGLYLSNRVASGVSVNDAARKAVRLRSPWFVAIGALFVTLLLTGCTAVQKEKVNTTFATICMSAPLAQALYNTALASGDNAKVNQILDFLRASCPAVQLLIQTVPTREPALPPPVVPTPGPERG